MTTEKRRHLLVGTLIVALSAIPAPAPAQNFAAQLSEAYAEITSRLEPVVVSIDVTEVVQSRRRGRNGAPREVEGVGSGVIVDPAGHILTNNHVIEDAVQITVRLSDDSELPATVIGTDPETDLALLQVKAGRDLPAATLGNSDAVRPGHLVLALGSPFGFNNSVSAGIVSAKGRDIPGTEQFQRFIQTDAAIHPGNSGGPLVNMAGEVIGINTAVVSTSRAASGLGFALPSNMALQVYKQLLNSGRVVRGSIGITYRPETAGVTTSAPGVLVTQVHPNGPAEAAGMRSGDLIVAIAGEPVDAGATLLEVVSTQSAGATIPVRVLRNGAEMDFRVVVVDRAQLYPEGEVLLRR